LVGRDLAEGRIDVQTARDVYLFRGGA
jgi:hypothetical protein